jgi:hypothetical protein
VSLFIIQGPSFVPSPKRRSKKGKKEKARHQKAKKIKDLTYSSSPCVRDLHRIPSNLEPLQPRKRARRLPLVPKLDERQRFARNQPAFTEARVPVFILIFFLREEVNQDGE